MKQMSLFRGAIKSIPGVELLHKFNKATGGTDKARYCYAVWLRHLILAFQNGIRSIPKRVMELGPGDSLGIGLCALLCGADYYFAVDVIRYANVEINLEIFEGLVFLFRNKSPVPPTSEFLKLRPELTCYCFPSHILYDEYLEKMLDEDRLNKIRQAIREVNYPPADGRDKIIDYRAPWNEQDVPQTGTMDMVVSQTALQHMSDLDKTYCAMYAWLREGGIISHRIDLSSTGLSHKWDGHWAYSDFEWKIILGRSGYFINRHPYSAHIKAIVDNKFRIICNISSRSKSSFLKKKQKLANRFRNLSDEDLTISGVFIQAVK